jgi:tRNA threonylcarbamoyladenosine modification (KEOPS) complex  Pcc1 subunit
LEAEIVVEYADPRTARAIAEAISPDNLKAPINVSASTTRRGSRVITKITCEGKLETFIATIDDLLLSTSIAEKVLQTQKKP